MAFTGLSINTGVHVCLPYFVELKRCHNTHTYRNFDCKTYEEDYLECHNKDKMVQAIVKCRKV